MQVTLIGVTVCALLLLIGRTPGASLIVALLASSAFGSTSIASLGGLGTPLIYIVFELVIILVVLLRRRFIDDLAHTFRLYPICWILLALLIYSAGSAVILPRLFAGTTGAFVPVQGLISEVPLGPVPGNIAQSGYFVVGGLTFLAVCLLLAVREHEATAAHGGASGSSAAAGDGHLAMLLAIRKGFMFWIILNTATGALDLLGKMAGGGDLMLPLRTAAYAFLTDTEHAGFFRIAGLYSEASAFGAAALGGLAFSFTYWRATRSRMALGLAIGLLTLTLLSTSTTAYAGLAVMSAVAMGTVARSVLSGRLLHTDAGWIGLLLVVLAVVLTLLLVDSAAFDKIDTLLRVTILEKSGSASGVERAYWNQRSLDSFFTTSMLGIGLGSSRSSSWVIAVLSQLGLIGSLLIGVLVAALALPLRRHVWGDPPLGSEARSVVALHDSSRAMALAMLLAATIGGGAADPGILFFMALATVLGCRRYLERVCKPAQPVEHLPLWSPREHARGQIGQTG
ncbi:hypothetical protein MWN34_10120 [Ancylobacter sp. 6x-1]|uniref:Uncharacterized protein n=1 Tax=Ancylobacter crimeensis TaxID=2579147 RepID=A0ABT0DBD0_9HYPH|nr:hypothetical protein [Ancylobacter crimeensis]MCK0197268.1 hypothetical protein [Ancylobacter crimeensis]